MPTAAASLNSNDVFVLLTSDSMYVWRGKGSNDDEKKCGSSIASVLQGKRKLVVLDEGKEQPGFWTALGGQGEYASEGYLYEAPREPRLFQCSNAR